MIAIRTALALALLLAAGPALAGTPVTLNANLTDAAGQVTLGELFSDAGPARDVVVAQRTGPTVVLDAAAVQNFARRYGLDWANPRGISRIIVRGEGYGGPASQTHEILTYTRNIAAGEIVQSSDLVWAKAAANPVGAPSSTEAIVGMAARRPLQAGEPVLNVDVTQPLVVKAGDSVLVTYAAEGMILTLQGRALGNAALGDSVNVLNAASKKTIAAVATGADQAVVGPEALRLKAERNPAQIALR